MKSVHKVFWLIIVLVIFAVWIDLPDNFSLPVKVLRHQIEIKLSHPQISWQVGDWKFFRSLGLKKGLDIQGGMQVVLATNMSDIPQEKRQQALESARSVINQRVDLYGVTESNVKTVISEDNYRIIVELPGVDNPQEALSLIGQTARLDFATPQYQADESSTESAQPLLAGFVPTDLTGADLQSAQVTWETKDRSPAVALEFTSEGAKKFARLTSTYLDKPLAIMLDGQIISAPVVQAEITTGQAIISGSFTTKQARFLATQLNAGALPVSISILSQKNIPATLGERSIRQSVAAGGIGLAMVILFICLYYGKLGIIASLGLAIYGLITLALYKLIPITLTLPGIAGFILSVGMAVDSNILIFERFKEEKRANKSTPVALELGFGRAWDSIRDANIATIMTAFVLFNPLDWQFLNSSGSIRGFALTLILGILISLFTGIVVTRTLLRIFLKKL